MEEVYFFIPFVVLSFLFCSLCVFIVYPLIVLQLDWNQVHHSYGDRCDVCCAHSNAYDMRSDKDHRRSYGDSNIGNISTNHHHDDNLHIHGDYNHQNDNHNDHYSSNIGSNHHNSRCSNRNLNNNVFDSDYDIVICSDVLFSNEAILPLVHTIQQCTAGMLLSAVTVIVLYRVDNDVL